MKNSQFTDFKSRLYSDVGIQFQHSLGLCDLKSTFLKETNKKWETTRILLIFSVMKIYCKILSNEIKA